MAAWLRGFVCAGLALVGVSQVAAQDFYFISSRDSVAGQGLNFEIYRYQNGTETRITTTGLVEEHPELSVSGNVIYFARKLTSGVTEIHRIPVGGGTITQVTSDGGTSPFEGNTHAFLAPDEMSLFVTTKRNDNSDIIRRVDLAGVSLGTVVDKGSGVELGHSPAVTTPAGDKLYYASDSDGDYELYRSNLDGSGEQQLTANSVYDSGATPSPNGQKVAFTREDSVDPCVSQIWVMDHDGANPVQLTTDNSGFKWAFGWDGTNILYASNESGDQRIYSIGSGGLGKALLVNSSGDDMHLIPDAKCGFNLPEIKLNAPPSASCNTLVVFSVTPNHPNLVQYAWDFGDGQTAVTSVPSTTHSYAAGGTYNVSVAARDSCTPPNESPDTLPSIAITCTSEVMPMLPRWSVGLLLLALTGVTLLALRGLRATG